MATVAAPARPATTLPESPAQLWARGALVAGSTVAVAAAVLMLVVLAAWAADPRSSASAADASRLGLAVLVLACRVPLHVTGGAVALPPLGITLLVGANLYRGAATLSAWWCRTDLIDLRDRPRPGSWRRPAHAVVAVAVPFAALVTLLAVVARDPVARPSVALAPFAALALAALAAGLGARRAFLATGSLPGWCRGGLAGGGLAAAVLLGGATVLTVASLAAHGAEVAALATPPGGGVVATVVLSLGSLLVLPNLVCAAVGYLVGAGFAAGTGNVAGLGAVHLEGLPPVPPAAAVPHGPAPIPVLAATLLVVAAAGIVAATYPREVNGMREALTRAGMASATAAVVLGGLAGYAGGPAGPGGLATVGASGWRTGLLVLVELAAVAVVTAVVRACRAAWRAR